MTEPDVTLTDYGLAILCAILAHLIFHRGDRASPYRLWLVAFFLAAGAAPLFGGTVHGFFSDEASLGHRILWPATMLSIGVAALTAWAVGARLLFSKTTQQVIVGLATVQLMVYAAVVLVASQDFRLAIGDYLPATLFLLVALLLANRKERARPLVVAAAGLALTFVAAAIQQLEIPLHPIHLDHNALYHVIQAVALLMFFVGARYLASRVRVL
jgi:hypothetical protein